MTLGASRIGFWFLNDPVEVTWSTSEDGVLGPPTCEQQGGWAITNQGRTIRFNVQTDAGQCGGCNPNIQTGTATATLAVGATPYYFNYNLSGMGEGQDPGFEIMKLTISGGAYGLNTELINAQSAGGNLGCVAVPVVQTIVTPGPLYLATGTNYTFTLFFTTGDALFNIDSYYECTLSFTRA